MGQRGTIGKTRQLWQQQWKRGHNYGSNNRWGGGQNKHRTWRKAETDHRAQLNCGQFKVQHGQISGMRESIMASERAHTSYAHGMHKRQTCQSGPYSTTHQRWQTEEAVDITNELKWRHRATHGDTQHTTKTAATGNNTHKRNNKREWLWTLYRSTQNT